MHEYTAQPIPGVDGHDDVLKYRKNPVYAWIACLVGLIIFVVAIVATIAAKFAYNVWWFVIFGIVAVIGFAIFCRPIIAAIRSARRSD